MDLTGFHRIFKPYKSSRRLMELQAAPMPLLAALHLALAVQVAPDSGRAA